MQSRLLCWIRAGGGSVRVGGTVWNNLKQGGKEKRGGETKILKRVGKLGQGMFALIKRGTGTPSWTMKSNHKQK